MSKLNQTAKLAFFTARQRRGDVTQLSEDTFYSVSHISNITAGRRSVPKVVANRMYTMSRNRTKNFNLVEA